MARSVEDIFNNMVSTKESLMSLVGYTPSFGSQNAYMFVLQKISTKSYVSLWLLLLWVVAVAINTTETLWDYFKQEVLTLIANHKPGTVQWYRQQAFNYQDGYDLVWINDKYQYLTIDSTARIIAQCSVIELNGEVRIKVASVDSSGDLQALSNIQLSRVRAYFQRIKYAGTRVVVVSYSADDVIALFDFKYDALYDIVQLKVLAKSAVKSYLKSLKFDGAVNLNGIIDALQAVPGIVDAVPVEFKGKYGSLAYTSHVAAGEYPTNAGYAVLDETNFDTANWIPV